MSDSNDTEKENNKSGFGLSLFFLILLGIWISFLFYQKQMSKDDTVVPEVDISEQVVVEDEDSLVGTDIDKYINPRIMGDKNAPVKITEHSSFTCGACGLFHATNFKKIKAEYVDTGKAYIVFDDLTINANDISISAISRCVPEENFFKFVQVLYMTQKDWVNASDFVDQIVEEALAAGASKENVKKCYNSKKLRDALAASAKRAYDEKKINRTPTLDINGVHMVTGVDAYETIRDYIEAELAKVDASKHGIIIEDKSVGSSEDEIPEIIKDDEEAGGSIDDLPEEEPQGAATTEEPSDEVVADTTSPTPEKIITLDIKALVEPRMIGNIKAPLKITEHSSFTCGACKSFHTDNFEKIKAEYIDTGKAYLVFDDFPRNGHDITISTIARCVPDDAYFKFIHLIFDTQGEWIRKQDYDAFIKQNAKLIGVESDYLEQCSGSKEVKEAIAVRGQEAYENLGIDSTPTIIINDERRVVGALPYEDFKKVLDEELEKINAKPAKK